MSVDDRTPCSHSDRYLLLFAAELRHAGTAIDTCAGCVVKWRYTDKTGVLARCIKVLEVIGIYDSIYGRDNPDPNNTENQIIGSLERSIALDNLQHLLFNGVYGRILLSNKAFTPTAALGGLIVPKFSLL